MERINLSTGKFIVPFSDWGFKRIFGREESKGILINFLNALFSGRHVVTDLTYVNKERQGETKDSRTIAYDIYCTTSDGENIIVEMQNERQRHFVDRSIFYTARAIADQGQRGKWDYELAPVYTICFMNFRPYGDSPMEFRTDAYFADRLTGKEVSPKVRVFYLMLPLFNKKEEECENDFERWIYVLKNMNTLQSMPFMAENPVFEKLSEIADYSTLTKEERSKYDESLKDFRDRWASYTTAVEEGEGRGIKKGRKEGRKEGEAIGFAKGDRNRQLFSARQMLTMGFSDKDIMLISGLDEESLQRLKQEEE